MLLKKQTVWLLTMLSLVVVLSVYYVTSDPSSTNQVAKNEASKTKTESKEQASSSKNNVKITTKTASNEVFEELRLERQDEMSKQQEELTNKLASNDLTPDEKSKAYDEMQKLTERANKEQVLETLIKSKGYDDALVQADGNQVIVTVKSSKHDKAAANQILKLVNEELGNSPKLAVEFK